MTPSMRIIVAVTLGSSASQPFNLLIGAHRALERAAFGHDTFSVDGLSARTGSEHGERRGCRSSGR